MSFGLVPLLISMGERHFIRHMDAAGVITRGGKHIAWNEFTGISRTKGTMEGIVLSDEYLLQSARGKVSLPAWRAENAKEAMDFLLRHLPSSTLHIKR
jgi:hypothetical protein